MESRNIFTEDEVRAMMMKAFIKGENWGVAYSGWFVPSQEEKAERASEDCVTIYEEMLISKQS